VSDRGLDRPNCCLDQPLQAVIQGIARILPVGTRPTGQATWGSAPEHALAQRYSSLDRSRIDREDGRRLGHEVAGQIDRDRAAAYLVECSTRHALLEGSIGHP
jgi:hypothetical protein